MLQQIGLKPDVISYSAAISARENAKQPGKVPNMVTYSAAISACGKAKQPDKAIVLLEMMLQNGMEPDVITYNAATSACEMPSSRSWHSSFPAFQLQCSNQRMRLGQAGIPEARHDHLQGSVQLRCNNQHI